MKTDLLKQYVYDNVLTTTEVSELLGITKQMVSVRFREGKLKALKETPNGLLFYYPDVIESKNNVKNDDTPICLFCGNTRQSMAFILEHIIDLDDPIRVDLFFNDVDAIIEGFYLPFENSEGDGLFRLQPATMAITGSNGRKLWTDGCNCGYSGTGPSGTKTILEQLGVPSDLTSIVGSERVIKFFKDDTWTVKSYNSFAEREKEKIIFNQHKTSDLRIFRKDNHFVIIQTDSIFNDVYPSKLLERYSVFIPNPIYVKILNRENAKQQGYIYKNYLHNSLDVYQLIIQDANGNELWLSQYIGNDFEVVKNTSIMDLLEYCGIALPQEKFSEKIMLWLNNILLNKSEMQTKVYKKINLNQRV